MDILNKLLQLYSKSLDVKLRLLETREFLGDREGAFRWARILLEKDYALNEMKNNPALIELYKDEICF